VRPLYLLHLNFVLICERSPTEQDEMVASALRRSRLSAVATRVYQVPRGKMTPWDMLMKDHAQPS